MEDAAKKVTETAENVTDKAIEKMNAIKDSIQSMQDNKNFILGTWSGKFDDRSSELVITEMEGNNIAGKVTINYRNKINQELKGTYDPASRKIRLEDQLHSRFKGAYVGQLSEDQTKFSGVFTTLVDGKKFKFNYEKSK
jgi:hypothetical protein